MNRYFPMFPKQQWAYHRQRQNRKITEVVLLQHHLISRTPILNFNIIFKSSLRPNSNLPNIISISDFDVNLGNIELAIFNEQLKQSGL